MRSRQEKEEAEAQYATGFPKPVMVYSNPNFKPYRPETKLVKQTGGKRPVIEPGFPKSPSLFLNRDPGSSFKDLQKLAYVDPTTGGQFGSQSPIPSSSQMMKLYQQSGEGKRPFGHPKKSVPIPPQSNEAMSQIERAKYIMKKSISEAAAILNNPGLAARANKRVNEPSFNTHFKNFYNSELQPAPGDVSAAIRLQRQSNLRPSSKQQRSSVMSEYQPELERVASQQGFKRNPKALYKISSKPGQRMLVHQQQDPSKRQAMMGYSSAKLDPPLSVRGLLVAAKEKQASQITQGGETVKWEEIERGDRDIDTVNSYVEHIDPSTGKKLSRLNEGMLKADPEDIDD